MNPWRFLAALLLPGAVALAYAPLHKGWLVQWFGCACAGQRGFSASTLSFLVHAAASIGSAILLWQATARTPLRQRMQTLTLAIIALALVCLWLWRRDCSV